MAPASGIKKQPSGAEKRRRRKKIEEFVKSQSNAMLKFIKKPDKSSNDKLDERKEEEVVVVSQNEKKKKEEHISMISEDMSDPANWRVVVDTGLRDSLVEKGPVARLPTDYQFPKDALGRHFSHELYIRVLANKETLDRRWLVYSEAFDKAFCFCCKLFRDDDDDDQKRDDDLVTRGYNDWGNVSTRFREHETSYDHIRCMVRWREMEISQQEKKGIDDDIGQSKVNNPVNLDECDDEDSDDQSEKEEEYLCEDFTDPGNWGKVDTRWRDLLVKIGPTTRPSSDYQFPKDAATGRRFSHALYVNGEKADRRWLVYSKVLDRAFCFSCKLFRDDDHHGGGNLATTGYNDWRNVSTRLKEHERCPHHILATTRWKMLEIRMHKNQTIDKLIML